MNGYFLKMIQNLRQQEETMLYGNILSVAEGEAIETTNFLQQEYRKESLNYPFTAPEMDVKAALWSARTIYIAAQLILYRENKSADLESLLPDFEGEINASAMLSCDLCLRFLPDMILQLKAIDSTDLLIDLLEMKLYTWHYSGVNYQLDKEKLDFDVIHSNSCLQQMYANRIVEYKKLNLATLPVFNQLIQANFGIFAPEFWNDFKIETILNEQQHG